MVIDVAWLRKNEVIWARLSDSIVIDDILKMGDDIEVMLDETDLSEGITLLIDAMTLERYPRNFIQWRKALHTRAIDKRICMTLHLTTDYFQRHLINLISDVFHVRIRSFTTYRQVVRYLNMPDVTAAILSTPRVS